jgi:hypothetical protein
MPLVQYYKAARIRKARRLSWQDQLPKTRQGRMAYEIAAKYQSGFARAFKGAVRDLLTDEDKKNFLSAYPTMSVDQTMASLPFYSKMELARGEQLPQAWQRFAERMVNAYARVILASGEAATEDMNRRFGTNMKFSIEENAEVVQKASRAKPGAFVPTVPVNPYSIKWMRERSLGMVKDGMNEEQRAVIRNILTDGFSRGVRAEEAYKAVQSSIGLSDRYAVAVQKRRALHENAGLPSDQVDSLTELYAAGLLASRAETIARTETFMAQAQGRNTAWQLAIEVGELPTDIERIWITGPDSANPNAPCSHCEDLDGARAPIGGKYDDEVEMPPAHPRCRCTEALVRSESSDNPFGKLSEGGTDVEY